MTQKSAKELQSEEAQHFAQQWAEGGKEQTQLVEGAVLLSRENYGGTRSRNGATRAPLCAPDNDPVQGGISQGHTVT